MKDTLNKLVFCFTLLLPFVFFAEAESFFNKKPLVNEPVFKGDFKFDELTKNYMEGFVNGSFSETFSEISLNFLKDELSFGYLNYEFEALAHPSKNQNPLSLKGESEFLIDLNKQDQSIYEVHVKQELRMDDLRSLIRAYEKAFLSNCPEGKDTLPYPCSFLSKVSFDEQSLVDYAETSLNSFKSFVRPFIKDLPSQDFEAKKGRIASLMSEVVNWFQTEISLEQKAFLSLIDDILVDRDEGYLNIHLDLKDFKENFKDLNLSSPFFEKYFYLTLLFSLESLHIKMSETSMDLNFHLKEFVDKREIDDAVEFFLDYMEIQAKRVDNDKDLAWDLGKIEGLKSKPVYPFHLLPKIFKPEDLFLFYQASLDSSP